MDTPIPFPLAGLNENWAFGVQPDLTTQLATNVRVTDPKTGRARGAQREGLAKHYPTVVSAGSPVLRFTHMTFDKKKFTYEALRGDSDATPAVGDVEEEWSKIPSADQDVVNLARDSAGNLYALSGQTIEKFNTDGASLWVFQVPVQSDGFALGPLVVSAAGDIYTAVASGSEATGAAVYRIKQQPVANSFDTEPELAWEWTVDRWVRELVLHQGSLKVLQQDDMAYRSYVVTMVNISLAVPNETNEVQVPYPSTCLVVKEDGSYVTGHPPFTDRNSSPLWPGTGIALESWTADNMTDSDARVWSWYRASDLEFDGLGDGDEINFWEDRSGNGRHLYPGVPRNGSAVIPVPTLDLTGSLSEPTVRFDGTQGLFSLKGGGTDAQRDACKTAIPNHGDAAFCTFVVCRPSSQKTGDETDTAGVLIDHRRFLFQQYHHTKYGGSVTTNFDKDNTGAHVTGFAINSGSEMDLGEKDVYCWGKDNSKRGLHLPGYARPYTSSSGYRTSGITHDPDGYSAAAWVSGTSGYDWPGAPLLKGAGRFGWPKEGEYDDPTATTPGEGLVVFTFMHCGGLDEALEVAGTTGGATTTFTATDSTAFKRYPNGATTGTWTLYDDSGTVMDTITSIDTSAGTLTIATAQTATAKAYLVPPRNMMTRSLWRVNGDPIDRWEAFPMSYNGADLGAGATSADRSLNLNIEAQQTGLGLPEIHDYLRGFDGEIAEWITIGRRQTNADTVSLGGTSHHLYPSVIDHPMYAANAHTNDSPAELAWYDVGSNLLSTDMEKIEGWLMHRYGIASRLQAAADTYTHPHYPDNGTGEYDVPIISLIDDTGQAWPPRLRADAAMITKTTQSGKTIWCLLSDIDGTAGDIVSLQRDGVTAVATALVQATSGLVLDSSGDIYFAGPGQADGIYACGKIADSEDLPLVSTGFWQAGDTDEQEVQFPEDVTIRPKVDAFDNLILPIVPGSTHPTTAPVEAVRIFDPDGAYVSNVATLEFGTTGSNTYQNAWAVALPPEDPAYDSLDFLLSPNVKRPEFLYLGLERDDDQSGSAPELAKWRIVSATPTGDSGARETDFIAVANGDVYYDLADVWTKVSTNTTKLATTSTFISVAKMDGKVYFTDGASYRVYDPKDKSFVKWESSGAGTLPENCFLIAVYRDRIMLARGGQNWYMSAKDDPTNWDYFPPVITSDQAVAGSISPAGKSKDIINTLVPFENDYILLGGDHSIWQLTGDPMKGGELDLITDTLGMAFGDSWAKDERNRLYFFATIGGVYRMEAGGKPMCISDVEDGQTVSIQRRLQTIDLSTHRMLLLWDHRRRGLRVVQIPYSTSSTDLLKAWFWDRKNNAWMEDEPGSADLQPYSGAVIDGDDPADRAVVFGCKDGYVRRTDDDAVSDDGTAIKSAVRLGPLAAGGDVRMALDRLRAVFASDQSGCNFEVNSSPVPDDIGEIVATGRFQAGMSQRLPVFQGGNYLWITLRNTSVAERWAMESMLADFQEMDVRVGF